MATAFFIDARDDKLASSADKERLALNHFSFFLKSYCLQIGIKVMEAAQIPYHGIPKKKSSKAIFEFWDGMIGAFFHLHVEGSQDRLPTNPPPSTVPPSKCTLRISFGMSLTSQCFNPPNGRTSVGNFEENTERPTEHPAND